MTPIKLVPVQFYEDTIDALPLDGKVFVSLKRCCDALGLKVQRQLTKLKEQPWACVTIMVTHDKSGRRQELAMIDLDSLPMWLATVNAGKVAENLRPKLVRYQKEAARVLSNHFLNKPPAPPPPPPQPLRTYSIRCLEANIVERSLPDHHWCVFIEAARFLFVAEEVFIPAGLEMKAEDLLDGSIGTRWRRYRDGQPWARPSGTYAYVFPAGSARAGLSVDAHCYHDDELTRFRRWLRTVYAPEHFPEYVQRKYKRDGYQKALPHIRRAIPAAISA
jgi:hypothetical protein